METKILFINNKFKYIIWPNTDEVIEEFSKQKQNITLLLVKLRILNYIKLLQIHI